MEEPRLLSGVCKICSGKNKLILVVSEWEVHSEHVGQSPYHIRVSETGSVHRI